jgi:hypothetical protein
MQDDGDHHMTVFLFSSQELDVHWYIDGMWLGVCFTIRWRLHTIGWLPMVYLVL